MPTVVSSRSREVNGFLDHYHLERWGKVKDEEGECMYAGALKGRRGETGAIKSEKQKKGKVG